MTKHERFECHDEYEAEKLAGLTGWEKEHSTYIQGICDVIENELIVILKDSSSHCILMKDNDTAARLSRLLSEVVQGKKTIFQSSYQNCTTELIVFE